jgi:dipeptidyl aminopeptidase/acylaminoacyl peptidase
MDRDFRATPEWASIESFYRAVLAPGGGAAEDSRPTAAAPGESGSDGSALADGSPQGQAGDAFAGQLFSARGLCGGADGDALYFIGQSHDRGLDGGVSSRLCRVSRATGRIERLNAVETRQIRLAPDGLRLAVATAAEARTDAVTVLGPETEASVRLPGRIEAVDWSADGRRLLMVVAGRGADLAGIHGGHTQEAEARTADWLPDVRTDQGGELWRRVWIWDLAGDPRPLTAPPLNTWEASWCGSGHIVAAVSDHHGEGSWYRVRLVLVDAATGAVTEAVRPADQLGLPRGSPDGRRIAYIAALCSDRGLVAGTLSILDCATGTVTAMPTEGVDVTSIEWRTATVLHLSGLRDCETVNGDLDLATGRFTVAWSSERLTHGEWAPSATPIGAAGSLFVAEGYGEAPALVHAASGRVEVVASLAAPTAAAAMADCGTIAPFRWRAPDGLAISGWLAVPHGATAPGPLLVDVHGGPISAHRNRWMARLRATPLLVAAGWSVLMPNPRGSTGKGDGFVRRV